MIRSSFGSLLAACLRWLVAPVVYLVDFILPPLFSAGTWLELQRLASLADVKFLAAFRPQGKGGETRAVRMSGLGPVYA